MVETWIILLSESVSCLMMWLSQKAKTTDWVWFFMSERWRRINENKTLNRGEIVYFGTKLLIKTHNAQFLSMVQFVAIYALFWGTNQTKNLWRGDRIWFIGLGRTARLMARTAGLTNQPRDNVTTYICKLGSIQFTFFLKKWENVW